MTEGPYKLPEGWRWVRLVEVCQHRTGIWGPEASDPAQGFPIVRSTEIDGFLIRPQTASVRAVRPGQVDAYKLETGDILVNKSSGSPHLVGWPAIFEDPQDGRTYLFSNFMLRLRLDQHSLEPWFLLYYLHSPIARSIYLGAQDTTSGLRNLRVQEFMAQPIPLPPLAEQRRIVARIEELMDRVREARRLRQEAQKDAERLWQSVLAQTFPRPGSELPEGWRWVRLGEVCTLIEVGFAFRKKGAPEGDLLHLRPYNIGEDGTLVLSQRFYLPSSLGLARHKMLQPGDVLFNNTNSVELVGKTALVREPLEAAFSNHITLLRSDTTKAEGAWIALALQTLWRQGFFANLCNKWIGQAGINTETLKSVLIPLPPLAEQRRIVAHLEAVQERLKALKEAQAATEAELKRLEQAILEKAFRGEL
jgi:type I restriction enzyme S subunit